MLSPPRPRRKPSGRGLEPFRYLSQLLIAHDSAGLLAPSNLLNIVNNSMGNTGVLVLRLLFDGLAARAISALLSYIYRWIKGRESTARFEVA